MSSNDVTKVIWSVDAFAENQKLQFSTYKTLAKLIPGKNVEIEPVSVLNSQNLTIPASAFSGLGKQYALESETKLRKWVTSLKDKRLTPPTLLLQEGYSTGAAVAAFLKHARESQASLIAVGTNNKKGFERFFLGSFAETLILKSDIPVLVVNPRGKVPKKIGRILFPTDFSPPSRKAFERVVALAGALKAKVTLYFKFEYMAPDTAALMRATPSFSSYFAADLEAKSKVAATWVQDAAKSGVKVELILDEKPYYVLDGILKVCRKGKFDLIAMASHSGAISTAFLGSIARQVIRATMLPVWVIHPKTTDVQKQTLANPASLFSLRGEIL